MDLEGWIRPAARPRTRCRNDLGLRRADRVNLMTTAKEVVIGLALALLVRLCAGRRDPPVAAVSPRDLPSGGRLAGDPDPGDRCPAGLLVGLWYPPQARCDRPDLFLSGGRHDRRRACRRRSRPAQAAAHPRRLALAGVSLCGASRGVARGDQRRANRTCGRGDRRLYRRDLTATTARIPASAARSRPISALRLRGHTPPRRCCSSSRSPASTPSTLVERRLAPWANQSRGDIR